MILIQDELIIYNLFLKYFPGLRRDILTEELSKSFNENEEDWNGFVLLSNLRIPLNQINENKMKQTRFFLCVFRCGCTVFASELLMLNSNMELEIEDPICFDELPIDFEISVEIYTMHLTIRKESKGMKILKVSFSDQLMRDTDMSNY